jgi:predicted nucleotidyltransferase
MYIDESVRQLIISELTGIARDEQIKILFACESGSRAWGFPSPDSDYDVRFIYVRNRNDYLSITEKKDTLDFPINDNLDISGWDIKKMLHHIRKSNAVMFEWLQSPIKYIEDDSFLSRAFTLAQTCFSKRAVLHHYLGICDKYRPALKKGVPFKIKRFFYIIRPLLAALWTVRNESVPPMELKQLLILARDNQKIIDFTDELLAEKAQAAESKMVIIDPYFIEWIEKIGKECEANVDETSKTETNDDRLNIFFRSLFDT